MAVCLSYKGTSPLDFCFFLSQGGQTIPALPTSHLILFCMRSDEITEVDIPCKLQVLPSGWLIEGRVSCPEVSTNSSSQVVGKEGHERLSWPTSQGTPAQESRIPS